MTLTAFPLAFFIILDAYLKNLTSDGCAHIRGRAMYLRLAYGRPVGADSAVQKNSGTRRVGVHCGGRVAHLTTVFCSVF